MAIVTSICFIAEVDFWCLLKTVVSCDLFIIREYGSTLYVGLAHAVPPTNTNFQPLLLHTQAGMPYTNTHKHRTLYFKSTLTFMGPPNAGSAFPQFDKNDKFLRFFTIIIIINIFHFLVTVEPRSYGTLRKQGCP